jgi:hypothetical protein
MASKQYGLKIVHKPSNTVAEEKWFNTELERNNAMLGSTMEPQYIFVTEEKEVEPPADARSGQWSGSA